MNDWISFFDHDNPIYVNERHRRVHAALVGRGIDLYLDPPGLTVLDYGCGEALYAEAVAKQAGRLMLCEAAPHVLQALKERLAGLDHVSAISPEEAAALPDASVDLIVMVSVAQYLTPEETASLFRLFRRLLKPDGRLIVGDVVRPDTSAIVDAVALLRLAIGSGFFFAALLGLMRTATSDYRKLRQNMGLTRHSEAQMIGELAAAGFSATRARRNIGHNPARMTFVARPAQI